MSNQAILPLPCPKCQHVMKLPLARLPQNKPMGLVNCTQCGQAIKFKIPNFKAPVVDKTEIPAGDTSEATQLDAAFEGKLRDEQGNTYVLRVGVNVLGRQGDVALPAADKKISRKHCAIEVKESPGGWLVILSDDGSHTGKPSTNGTFSDENRLSKYDKVYLEDGDRFRVGRTFLTFKTNS